MNDTTIQTRTGSFDLANPTADQVRIEDIAYSLARICRFTGHVDGYTVAQHSVLVSNHCQIAPFEALLHDAGEAYYGDLSSPFKRLLGGDKQLHEVMRRIDAAVAEHFGLSATYSSVVKRVDLLLQATEKRDLFDKPCEAWDHYELPAPLKCHIVPWGKRRAERQFLTTYQFLKQEN